MAHSRGLSQATRTLRMFVSHTVSSQTWQVGEGDGEADAVNVETGQGIPAWSLKIEGRLLEVRLNRSSTFSRVLTMGSHPINVLETKRRRESFRLSSRG